MSDIRLIKLNEVFMRVECAEPHIEMELSDAFKFEAKEAKFDPRVKAKKWDGMIRLYNRTHKRMYTGLVFAVMKFAKSHDYTIDLDPRLNHTSKIEMSDLDGIVNDFIKPHGNGEQLTPYEYQMNAVAYALMMNRSIILAATSAGKSLIIYLLVRMYQMMDELQGKTIFIVVPNTMLVEQLYGDFDEYSKFTDSKWRPITFVQKISGKYSKHINKPIVITTWQSLKNIPTGYIIDAGAILVDEAQTVDGPVLKSLLETAVNCSVRHGLTGTLSSMQASKMAAEGLLGPSKVFVTAKENIDAGRATPVDINVVVIDHDEETKKRFHDKQREARNNVKPNQSLGAVLYQSEIEFIYDLNTRRQFIIDLALKSKGNTVVLFNRVESYGMKLYEACKQVHKNTFLIVGDVDSLERDQIRKSLETMNDAIVFATDRIMSTGISIKNLHNVILGSSDKAEIKLIQTLGRLMRLHDSKKVGKVYDIVDRLELNGKRNATMGHLEERVKAYKSEQHPVKFVRINLEETKRPG